MYGQEPRSVVWISGYGACLALLVLVQGSGCDVPVVAGHFACDPAEASPCPPGLSCEWSAEHGEHRCIDLGSSEPRCGDGEVDQGEACDGEDLAGQSCLALGFFGGTLACTSQCTLDDSACTRPPSCGDGVLDPGEDCDGSNLGGMTCESLGWGTGALACTGGCLFDSSGCTAGARCGNGEVDQDEECDDGNQTSCDGCSATCVDEACGNGRLECDEECDDGNLTLGDGCSHLCLAEVCGNGRVDQGEACDGADLDGETCQAQGFYGGILACYPTCVLDTSSCFPAPSCGNSTIEAPEQCDGVDLDGQTCVLLGYLGGELTCASNCEFDLSGCHSCADQDGDLHLGFHVASCPQGDDHCDTDPTNWTTTGCSSCVDQDGDGMGESCDLGPDCDDADPTIWTNCICVDFDRDGYGVHCALGPDCDDQDRYRNPGVYEACGDGIDNDCDGRVDNDCLTECEIATLVHSNLGCELFTVDTDNYPGNGDTACYAVIVSNPHAIRSANVQVLRWVSGGPQPLDFPGLGTSRIIPPGGHSVFRVSGSCSAPGAAVVGDAGVRNTALGARGAFEIVSDLPVVAYQINPFEAATIHSTDASLLIPREALGRSYYLVSYPQTNPSRGSWDLPANYNIVATEDNTVVTITSSTAIRAGTGIPALAAGQVWSTTLNAFDNLQMATATTGNDVSGTYIQASAPLAVWAGNQCADVPVNVGYCDHLEEQIPPLATAGTQHACARHPPRGTEPVIWRFLAVTDGTTLTFDPPVAAPITLNARQVHEIITTQDFLATSDSPDKPFLAMQFMVGADYGGIPASNLRGDPAMTLSVPTIQYMDRYAFFVDTTYAYNWLVVVRSSALDTIRLDCWDPIPDIQFVTIGSGPFQVARVRLSAETGGVDGTCTSGAHVISGNGMFGVWVFGVHADTSYGYPGGMKLAQIYNAP